MNKDPGNITEFFGGKTGACGPTALEEAEAAIDGRQASDLKMLDIVGAMALNKWADTNGITTLAGLGLQARGQGYQTPLEWDYGNAHLSNTENWHQVLLSNAGVNPIVLFLTNGQALRDAETGAHDEVGLHGHFICVLDKQADGYKCTDGDNPQVGKRYCIYNYQTLINAQVSGLLVVTKGTTVADRTWPGIGSGLTAELNKLNLPDTYKVLLAEDDIPGRDELAIVVGDSNSDVMMCWNKGQGVYEPNWNGHAYLSQRAYAKSLEVLLKDAQDKLNAQPKATPAPAVPAELHNAITEMLNLTQPFADINATAKQVAKELGY